MNSLFWAASWLLTAASAPAAIDLPAWEAPAGGDEIPFQLGAGSATLKIWGGGVTTGRFFAAEFLPALFERTLILDEADLQAGRLQWIFTGDRGGFTVLLAPGEVLLSQRYYDSFGLTERVGDRIEAKRHPERRWIESRAAFRGDLRAVTVVLDHRLGLVVKLNGREAIRRTFELDVRRHQLRWSNSKATVRGRILRPAARDVLVRVLPERRRQTILGFGGIATPTAYAELSSRGKEKWWELLRQYNLLIQREYPMGTRLDPRMDNWDRLADATPHYYGDNFPNGEVSDFHYIKTLRKLGGKVFFEFWALPPWTRQDWTDPDGRIHRGVADPKKYAEAMVGYCRASRARTGWPPDVVGVQNEVTQPTPLWHEMVLALRESLDRAGFSSVRIHMSDAGRLGRGIERAAAFQQSAAAWAAIDYAASHMYDYQQYFENPDGFDPLLKRWRDRTRGKPFLSTELCVNSGRWQLPTYRIALAMGQLYHKNLVIADASALCYCWTLLNVEQPSYGWTRSLFIVDRAHGFAPAPSSAQLRVFGAYSRRVKEGMVRVEAVSDDPDLLPTAFSGEDGVRTVILLNRGLSPRRVRIDGAGPSFRYAELVDPYHENERVSPPARKGEGSMIVEAAPGAIVTLSDEPLNRPPSELRRRG